MQRFSDGLRGQTKPPSQGLMLVCGLSPTESRPWLEGALSCEVDAQRVATLAECETHVRNAASGTVLVAELESVAPRFFDRSDETYGASTLILLSDRMPHEPWLRQIGWVCVARNLDAEACSDVLASALAEATERHRERRQVLEYHRCNRTLSDDEREVFDAVCAGRLNKQIANEMNVSVRTIEQRRRRVFQKMGVESAVPLATLRATVETLESQWNRLRQSQPLRREQTGPPTPHMNVGAPSHLHTKSEPFRM